MTNLPNFRYKLIYLLLVCTCISCNQVTEDTSSSPFLPLESLEHFEFADKGLQIKLVAAEPLVYSPVSIKFDAKGRIWVVEMTDYMLDIKGTDQNEGPAGCIAILEDRDQDGQMDHRTVFMDSLLLPRAIAFHEDGLLVVEPPKLLIVKIDHNSSGEIIPGAITVIDTGYATTKGSWDSNVELQANGLFRGLDNWIYNAYSSKRYRKIGGEWVAQYTHFRGQWGITQDEYGRLFYTHNLANLLGDFFLPSLGAWNMDIPSRSWGEPVISGFGETIAKSTFIYPNHPTPAVDVGYVPGVLDDSGRLTHFTAASGPVIYTGGILGGQYEGNGFVCAPVGNLIKRNILEYDGFRVIGKVAYEEKDFLASDDDRFRPVELKVGPNGGLYIVDMYKGIIQDHVYVTSYLKEVSDSLQLQYPQRWGRIYQVVPKDKKLSYPELSQQSSSKLVGLLGHPNSWIRQKAQCLLVDSRAIDVEEELRQRLRADTTLAGKIHSFWTLEGLGKLRPDDIHFLLQSDRRELKWQAVSAVVAALDDGNVEHWLTVGSYLLAQGDQQLAPYVGFLAAAAIKYAPENATDLLMELAMTYQDDPYVADAVISGLEGREQEFLKQFQRSDPTDTSSVFYRHLNGLIIDIQNRIMKKPRKENIAKIKFPRGEESYDIYCVACHQRTGNGIPGRGAPLNGSSWVTGNKQVLLAIVLKGLYGPIEVNGKIYDKPEVSGIMPAFGQNDQFSDEDIAQILSYIRLAWTNKADAIDAMDVKKARVTFKNRKKPYTMEELLDLEQQLE